MVSIAASHRSFERCHRYFLGKSSDIMVLLSVEL